MDFFNTIGFLGLASRLKRLSDSCMSEVKQIYATAGVDFEPKWFPLFYMLYKQGEITITEAAANLGMTHPHISQLAKEMLKAKLIVSRSNKTDGRSRIIALSTQGKNMANKLEPLWQTIKQAVSDITYDAEPGFLMHLEKMEQVFKNKPLSRAVRQKEKRHAQENCKIINYTPALKKDFERLNREWLEKNFAVEDVDIKYFSDPEKLIIAKGGDIFFAELDGTIVGTCALLYDDGKLEMGKMAVTEIHRGKGIGELLAQEALKRARQKKETLLTLVTHSSLTNAIRLYEKLGFKATFRGQHPKYARGDLVMENAL
jgi:ribosomal protein S18 acetylase RimI-like enzyme/DNA-binding transcriptional ArsR family regulator